MKIAGKYRDDYLDGCIEGYNNGYSDGWFDAKGIKAPFDDKPTDAVTEHELTKAFIRGYKRGYKDGRKTGRIYFKGYLYGFDKGYDLGEEEAEFTLNRAYTKGMNDASLMNTAGYEKALMDSEWAMGILYTLRQVDTKRLERLFDSDDEEEILYIYGIKKILSMLKEAGIGSIKEAKEEKPADTGIKDTQEENRASQDKEDESYKKGYEARRTEEDMAARALVDHTADIFKDGYMKGLYEKSV